MMAFGTTEGNQSWQVSYKSFPASLPELQALPEASLAAPHYAAALLIPALRLWSENRDEAIHMINFLKGPAPLSAYEQQFISERLRDGAHIPLSYFDGASPENGYRTQPPYTVTVFAAPASFAEPGYAQLWLRSGGADSPRPVKLRQKPSTGQWFLWDQMLLAQIRRPLSQDPWA